MLGLYFIHVAKTIISKVVVGIQINIKLDSIKEREK
jgi:hypothetical protein